MEPITVKNLYIFVFLLGVFFAGSTFELLYGARLPSGGELLGYFSVWLFYITFFYGPIYLIYLLILNYIFSKGYNIRLVYVLLIANTLTWSHAIPFFDDPGVPKQALIIAFFTTALPVLLYKYVRPMYIERRMRIQSKISANEEE